MDEWILVQWNILLPRLPPPLLRARVQKYHRNIIACSLQSSADFSKERVSLHHPLGQFSSSYFSKKTGFHISCKYLHWREFAWNVKSCLLRKIRKIFQNVIYWNFYPACKALNLLIPEPIPQKALDKFFLWIPNYWHFSRLAPVSSDKIFFFL